MKIQYNRGQKIEGSLTGDFEKDVAFIEAAMENSGDMVKNLFRIGRGSRQAYLLYVDGLTDSQTVQDFAIRPLIELKPESYLCESGRGGGTQRGKGNGRKKRGRGGGPNREMDYLSYIEKDILQMVDWSEAESYEDMLTGVLSGNSLLLVEGCRKAILMSTRNFPSRGVGETEQEMVIRGPRDSFTENFRTNTALIRRRIRDPRLKMEHVMVGERSKTDLAICYVEDLVRPDLLIQIRDQIGKISLDGIFDDSMLEQLIEIYPWTPFPQFQHTERPDKAASGLLEGRIVLVVDNSPGVLILPVTAQMFFQAGDDYYNRTLTASFARLLRFAASLFAMGFPGLYVAIASFHTEMLPSRFLLAIASARMGIAIPVVAEVLLMELQFELLREAGIHIPGQLGSTIGIVGGLIVGQAAVDAGLVSNIVVIVVAFTAITSFVVPNDTFAAAFRLLKFSFILMASVWGIYGYLLMFAAVLFHLSQMDSFGIPYMMPAVCGGNLNYDPAKDNHVRYSLYRMLRRPLFTRMGRRVRRKKSPEEKM
ncbi:MAG: spore germination protein [Eubacterium sp.]|nr:spore germination protein [Eubacterium sp.]